MGIKRRIQKALFPPGTQLSQIWKMDWVISEKTVMLAINWPLATKWGEL